MHWYIAALKKYADFSGRARRMELGAFYLISILISMILGVIDGLTGLYILGFFPPHRRPFFALYLSYYHPLAGCAG